ncbi:hypothetical protein PR048_002514 [Dryococelus australis]|uniref:Integrase zinc-binding domain-containing protein n=1 Tax=Dryococelus australis TaxID=614101 RepID=A0ABQ9IKD7_9NEOP|nr:hypothetical protein PR048_002514 [Dryococelus australis]
MPMLKETATDLKEAINVSIQGTLRLAREHVFWDGMTEDVTEYIRKCATCQKLQRDLPQGPLSEEKDTSTHPWMYVRLIYFNSKERAI